MIDLVPVIDATALAIVVDRITEGGAHVELERVGGAVLASLTTATAALPGGVAILLDARWVARPGEGATLSVLRDWRTPTPTDSCHPWNGEGTEMLEAWWQDGDVMLMIDATAGDYFHTERIPRRTFERLIATMRDRQLGFAERLEDALGDRARARLLAGLDGP